KQVLGGTKGTLTVDGYTGYNAVTDVEGRDRTGCWSHVRRKLFEAMPSAPEARQGLDIILDLFMVERKAKNRGIVGTPEHLHLVTVRDTKPREYCRRGVDVSCPLSTPTNRQPRPLAMGACRGRGFVVGAQRDAGGLCARVRSRCWTSPVRSRWRTTSSTD